MASSAQLPPHKSFYPTFGSAFTLARRLDIPITTETLKRLEFVEDPEKDSRPLKKRKVIDIDNEVDLGVVWRRGCGHLHERCGRLLPKVC
jgi:hypothetical protein